jgi:hypothetical protein
MESESLRSRLVKRKALPRKVFWDISSSESPSPVRSRSRSPPQVRPASPPLAVPAPVPVLGPEACEAAEVPEASFRVTSKEEQRVLDPRFLQHMGYVNRNARPASSKRKEILLHADERRPVLSPASLQERRTHEARLMQQFRELAQRRPNAS